MAIMDNNPTFSWIKISGAIVTYNNNSYLVYDKETNYKYIYWNANTPYQFEVSNVMLDRSVTRILVVVNDNGIHTVVPSTSDNFEITFDGDSKRNIDKKIYGLYEQNKENNEKFIAIETDINGIKTVVGSTDNITGTIVENISKLNQTSESISIEVNKTTKEIENNKVRDSVNKSFIKFVSDIGTFHSALTDYFKDNSISASEKSAITSHISIINSDKSNLYSELNKVIAICDVNGDTSGKQLINNGKSALDLAHTNLVNTVNSVISDSAISTNDRTLVSNTFAQENLRINELKNVVDDIIILGVGGSISEEIAKINVKSNEISLSVQNTEKNLSSEISIMQGQIASKVSSGDVFSIIKQSPSAVEYAFNGISPTVTINSSGLTVNQGSIACHTLTTPAGADPYLSLFGNIGQCAIDATANMNTGIGDAIRFKWNNWNYLLVKENGIDMFIGSSSVRYAFRYDSFTMKGDDMYIGQQCRFDCTGTAFRIWADYADTGIRVTSSGNVDICYYGSIVHQFKKEGTKSGGSIELGGIRFGMSPIDSPQVLIEDMIFDLDISEEGTIVKLDSTFKESISAYAVFPSNSKCEITDICKDGFKVTGFTGKCSFRITGKRIGYENQYYNILGGEDY